MSRIVCQFSCGAASAVATKIVLAEEPPEVLIVNAFIVEEVELAARAAGYSVAIDMNWGTGGLPFFHLPSGKWNPLASDGDALRLAVKLDMTIIPDSGCVDVNGWCVGYYVDHAGDKCAALRRAIVRVAAQLEKDKP